jgi:inner membrane protein
MNTPEQAPSQLPPVLLPQQPAPQQHPPSVESSFWSRMATMFKIGVIGFLILLLLIPLSLFESRLRERLTTRNQAVSEITQTWGSDQFVAGPLLQVPYEKTIISRKEVYIDGKLVKTDVPSIIKRYAWFLPADYDVKCSLAPSERYRGIYKAVLYRGDFTFKGTFARPNFQEWKIDNKAVLWDEASVVFAVTDLRGVTNELNIQFGEKNLPMQPGNSSLGFSNTLRAKLPIDLWKDTTSTSNVPFSLSIGLNGSGGVRIAPLGLQTTATIESKWPDPNFQGLFPPVERKISENGFTAEWKVAYYGRGYPQSWLSGSEEERDVDGNAIKKSGFGVDLYTPVDSYRLVERAVKYGILFIVMIFTGFFLFETLGKLRIHPLQYILVGVALCLFYMLLLALSELMSFGYAYLIGAVSSGAMITFYSASVLKGAKRAQLIALELVVIFAFLYTTLQLQDYALLLGTIGLFAALGIVMYATRNVDWYGTPVKK